MSTTTAQAIIKRYNDSARRFKILFVLSRNLQNMDLGEMPVSPVDLNQVYGKINVLRKMLENPQPEQVLPVVEELEQQIAAAWRWYEAADRKITPFILRSYCERTPELAGDQIILMLQFLLDKSEHDELDQAKIDYLLTQAFCVTDSATGMIKLKVASEQDLYKQIEALSPAKVYGPQVEQAVRELATLISEIYGLSTFEGLISGDYINRGRKLKASLGETFYHPMVLTKCVQLNALLRQKFLQLYKAESEEIRKFSQMLIDTGKSQIGTEEGVLSIASALEFSENTSQLINADYGTNSERLKTFIRIREMLTRAVRSYGPDPKHASTVEAVDLQESSLAARLQKRQEQIKQLLLETVQQKFATALQILDLERSRLVVSAWEKEALLRGDKETDPAKRAIYGLLARSVALISEINESYAYYRSQSAIAPHLSDTHLMAVNYYIMQAHQLANELEQMSRRLQEAGSIDRAADLSATRYKLLDTCWKIKV
ncbi:MAG: hypothetical protein RMM17_07725 [Acidobacteriota bacterium]|nr:hypothetical protein [Blastocatellia bacterium]MDW8412554.1 hypothetical protein [Acidobacteriota bacterium]